MWNSWEIGNRLKQMHRGVRNQPCISESISVFYGDVLILFGRSANFAGGAGLDSSKRGSIFTISELIEEARVSITE
jgi:hypothetical protein